MPPDRLPENIRMERLYKIKWYLDGRREFPGIEIPDAWWLIHQVERLREKLGSQDEVLDHD